MSGLDGVQRDFIDLLIRREALRFGDFTLKSGRRSPYFCNIARLATGGDLVVLGRCYAATLQARCGDDIDVIFGPAYSAIAIATATAIAYEELVGRPVGWCFDRKEAKAHGEGGSFVGTLPNAEMRVAVVDDVITDGGAKRDSLAKLGALGCTVAGMVIGVDRMEPGPSGTRRAIVELAQESGVPTHAILTINEAVEHLVADGRMPTEQADDIRAHIAVL